MVVELDLKNLNSYDYSILSRFDIEKEISNNPFAKYLVYLDENTIIGYLYYSDIYERCEINQIEVLIDRRGQGIGTSLMTFLISLINKNITLEVRVDNCPAIRLYEKFNFVKRTIRKGYYNGIDGILMEREYYN